MTSPKLTLTTLASAIILAGCGSSSSSNNRQAQLDCTAPAELTAATTSDMFAVTSRSNCLVRFDISDPSMVTPIGTLDASGDVVGLDFRPASGELFALSSTGELLIVDPMTAQTTQVTASIGDITGTRLDIDFNPAANALRLISDDKQNFRMGAPILEANSNQPAIVDGVFGYIQGVAETAYSNSRPGLTGTAHFTISDDSRTLYRQASNPGTLERIGNLFTTNVDAAVLGYNIYTTESGDNEHYALINEAGTPGIYTINPSTGLATLLRALPAPMSGNRYSDLAVFDGFENPALREFLVIEQTADNASTAQIINLDPTMRSSTPVAFEDSLLLMGVPVDEELVAFDRRTTNADEDLNTLYGLSRSGVLYRFNEDDDSGEVNATVVGSLQNADGEPIALRGNNISMDFNPAVDLLRILTDAGQNLRVNLDDGRVLADMPRDAGFAFVDGTVRLLDVMPPAPVAVGYRAAPLQLEGELNPLDFQYIIDARNAGLARVAVPNDGALVAVGTGLLPNLSSLPMDIQQAMDIAQEGTAYAALRTSTSTPSSLYTVNLQSGQALSIGLIGGSGFPEGVNAISVFIPAP